eukprot:2047334-Rhodomonas_salina.1
MCPLISGAEHLVRVCVGKYWRCWACATAPTTTTYWRAGRVSLASDGYRVRMLSLSNHGCRVRMRYSDRYNGARYRATTCSRERSPVCPTQYPRTHSTSYRASGQHHSPLQGLVRA